MVNKSECSKKFKKLAEKSTALAKKENRCAKQHKKLWTTYSQITELIGESTKNTNSANLIARKKLQKIDELKQIQKEREEELNKFKKDIKELEDKIKVLHETGSESQENKTTLDKLLKLSILKICTKTHISNKVPNVIQGFNANVNNQKINPFEIDPGPKTKNEIADALWENSFRNNEHAEQWKHLFNLSK